MNLVREGYTMCQTEKMIELDSSALMKEDESTYLLRISGESLNYQMRYRLIDLFSGAGGMSLGFSETFGQPFESVWANDFNQYCVDTSDFSRPV